MYITAMATTWSSVGHRLWVLATRWRVAVDRALEPHGLTHATYTVAVALFAMNNAGRSPLQRELAEAIGLEPLYVSKLVRSAERDGFLVRRADPGDGRAHRLTLTPIGRVRLRAAVGVVTALQNETLAPIGGRDDERAEQLVDLLDRLLDPSG